MHPLRNEFGSNALIVAVLLRSSEAGSHSAAAAQRFSASPSLAHTSARASARASASSWQGLAVIRSRSVPKRHGRIIDRLHINAVLCGQQIARHMHLSGSPRTGTMWVSLGMTGNVGTCFRVARPPPNIGEYGFDRCGSFLMSVASAIRRFQATDGSGGSSADGRRQSGRKDEAWRIERTASIRGRRPKPAATALLEHIDLPVNDIALAAIGPDLAPIYLWHHALVSRAIRARRPSRGFVRSCGRTSEYKQS